MRTETARRMTFDAASPMRPPQLRLAVDLLAEAHRVRTEVGQRLCSIVDPIGTGEGKDPARLLQELRRGDLSAPIPFLAESYRRYAEEEERVAEVVVGLISEHVTWPWLRLIKGVEPVPAARLLSRLDPNRAENPSGFWAYCGLATVPAVRYTCPRCDSTFVRKHDAEPPRIHHRPGGGPCDGELRREGGDDGVRVAQARSDRGERNLYNAAAKAACLEVGNSLFRAGGSYTTYYLTERQKLNETRPGWPPTRRHLTALRKMEKLFLVHLWLVWREGLGLPTGAPNRDADPVGLCGPWDMADLG